jgi:hypothetical protein
MTPIQEAFPTPCIHAARFFTWLVVVHEFIYESFY